MLWSTLIRALVFSVAILGFVWGSAHAASTYQACTYQPSFPMRVSIDSDVNAAPWRAAIAAWNRRYPGAFVEGGVPNVRVVKSSTTWVDMACGGGVAVVYAGTNVDLNVWAVHELGHTLRFRDWIYQTTDVTGYISPGRCPSTDYAGMMSYCSPRVFTADDDRAMASIGYRWRVYFAY